MAKPDDGVELRFFVSHELASRLDAILQANQMQARADFLVPVIEKAVEYEVHKAIVLLRCARINPLDRE
jgi:hypothetical protein